MIKDRVCVIMGAGGFIGGHLCKRLMQDGNYVVGVDMKVPEFRDKKDLMHHFMYCDLRAENACNIFDNIYDIVGVPKHKWYVFNLAADMGGMGFIQSHDAQILHNNLLININTLEAAYKAGVERYFFSSSVCVYPEQLQMEDGKPIDMPEHMAWPASPQDAYGWEKLTAENLCMTYYFDYGFPVRIGRFHNTYGPYGTWHGGREKAPAALCRKIAHSKLSGNKPITIDMWGDGQQIRPFIYVDDTVEGIIRVMECPHVGPINIGPTNNELTTIEEMAYLISGIAGAKRYTDFQINHIDGPEGVRSRGANNDMLRICTGWTPSIPLAEGLMKTYNWIEKQVQKAMDDGVNYEDVRTTASIEQ